MKDAAIVVERIRAGLESLPIRLPSGETMSVTASFGLTEMHPRRPVEEAIADADMALIRAKENGRNRLEFWSTD
jgi:diguanylate cyclase (GGDEF)-like protein